MIALFLSLLTIAAWGLWLVPSQSIPFKSDRVRTFYVALANVLLAGGVGLYQGVSIPVGSDFWASFGAGIFWSISSWAAFGATQRIGLARAMGIWAPLNIVTACVLGMLFFGEFLDLSLGGFALLLVSLVTIATGVVLIAHSRGFEQSAVVIRGRRTGLLLAVLTGILWGSYFIPLQISGLSLAEAVFPMSLGILAGAVIGVLRQLGHLVLELPSHYPRALSSGLLWGLGNFSSLALMQEVGTGRGFTIAQLCIVVNALVGVYWFRDPKPGTFTARKVLLGVLIAVVGGVFLGSLKEE